MDEEDLNNKEESSSKDKSIRSVGPSIECSEQTSVCETDNSTTLRKNFRITPPKHTNEKFADSTIVDELEKANKKRHFVRSNQPSRQRDVEFSVAYGNCPGDEEASIPTAVTTVPAEPGDVITSKKKEKVIKKRLTAKEKNRLMYDSDMSVALFTVDMEDLEPNKPVSLEDEIASLVSANKIPAIRQYIQERKELRKQKQLNRIEAEEKLFLQMKEEHRKQKVEQGHTKYNRRSNDYKAGEKSVMSVKQLHAIRHIRNRDDTSKDTSRDLTVNSTSLSKDLKIFSSTTSKSASQRGLSLLKNEIRRLDDYSRVDIQCREPLYRELPNDDGSNDVYLVKNSEGKYVSMPPFIPGLPKDAMPNVKMMSLQGNLPHTKPVGPLVTGFIGEERTERPSYNRAEFNLNDLENKLNRLGTEYNALTDHHLKKYLRNHTVRRRLEKIGMISNEGRVIVSRPEYNRQRRYMYHMNLMHQKQDEKFSGGNHEKLRRSTTARRCETSKTCMLNDKLYEKCRYVSPARVRAANKAVVRVKHFQGIKQRIAAKNADKKKRYRDKLEFDTMRCDRVTERMIEEQINREKLRDEKDQRRKAIRQKYINDMLIQKKQKKAKWEADSFATINYINNQKKDISNAKNKKNKQTLARHHVFQLEKIKVEDVKKISLSEYHRRRIEKRHFNLNNNWKDSADHFEQNCAIRRLEKKQFDNNYINNFNIRLHIIRQENDEKEKNLKYEKRRKRRIALGIIRDDDIDVFDEKCEQEYLKPTYLQSVRQTVEEERRRPNMTSPVYRRRPIRPLNPNIFGTAPEPYWPEPGGQKDDSKNAPMSKRERQKIHVNKLVNKDARKNRKNKNAKPVAILPMLSTGKDKIKTDRHREADSLFSNVS